VPYSEQEIDIPGAVPIGVTVFEREPPLSRQFLDQQALANAVGNGQDQVTSIEASGIHLRLSAKDCLHAQEPGERRDQELRTAGDEDDLVVAALVFLNLSHRRLREQWPDLTFHKRASEGDDTVWMFALQVQFSLAQGMEAKRWDMLNQIPQASHSIPPPDDTVPTQIQEKANLDGGPRD
jgi:hypothetical protein